MYWKLEVVVVPVADVDRAKTFYSEKLGFNVDHDTTAGPMRFVQLTPPESGCSIVIGTGMNDMVPGSLKGLQLVVPDVVAAHAELVARGVECGAVQVYGSDGPQPMTEGYTGPLDNVGFVFLKDPDGNEWAVQQISGRV